MSRRRNVDERIYREWEALSIFREPPVPADERLARAMRLHQSCLSNGNWSVPIIEAYLATYHAVVASLQARRFGEAIELCHAYLGHPDAGSEDVEYVEFKCYLATAHIGAGDLDSGLKEFRHVLDIPLLPLATRRHLVWNNLLSLFDAERDSLKMHDRLAAFIAELLEGWKGQARKARIAREAQSIADLLELLLSTYPPRKPAELADA